MNLSLHLNLLVAWLWVLLGFGSGLFLGLNFHRVDWLGGYTGFRRRLYRLAHISFFALGAVNLLFYFTARILSSSGLVPEVASFAFVAGAVSMPACCVLMAHRPQYRWLFAVPVISLLSGGVLTLMEVATV